MGLEDQLKKLLRIKLLRYTISLHEENNSSLPIYCYLGNIVIDA